jgi:hypothetical protein
MDHELLIDTLNHHYGAGLVLVLSGVIWSSIKAGHLGGKTFFLESGD